MAELIGYNTGDVTVALSSSANVSSSQLNRVASFVHQSGDGCKVFGESIFNGQKSCRVMMQPWVERFDGGIGNSYFDDFYNRIRLIPLALDFGGVTVGDVEGFVLWSAFLVPKEVTDQQLVTGGGITFNVNPIPTTPRQLEALEYLEFKIGTLNAGPPVFDDQYRVTIDGVTYVLPITGIRLQVWPFEHNWRTPPVESFSARTDIIVSHNGDEQRRALRDRQRVSYQYEYLISGDDDVDYFENLLFTWQMFRWAVPLETDRRTLGVALPIGTTVIPFNPDSYGYLPGESLILQVDRDTFELAQIVSVQPGVSITVAAGLKSAWPASADIAPSKIVKLPNAVRFQEETSRVFTSRIRWLGIPGDVDANLPAITYPQYQGAPVIDREPNFVGIPHTWTVDRLSSDSGLGPISDVVRANYPFMDREFRWIYEGRADIIKARELIGHLNGRQKSVWMPTWRPDFEVVSNIISGATVITVRDKDYVRFFSNHPARTHIFLLLNNGTYFCREWTIVVDLLDGTVNLVLDAAIDQAISISEISMLCYLLRRRSMSDDSSLTWHSSTVAEGRHVMRAVKA
tara:strand:+ start:9476 stop:11191 length:1716 start_codon:yes stop_codon:yes gene_type:complete